jgi:type III pantothenate kinase
MVTLLNIGNTHTQIARVSGGQVTLVRRVATMELVAGSLPAELRVLSGPCLAACVVPAAAAVLRQALPTGAVVFLDATLVTEVSLARVDASTLGADRIANAVAAVSEYGGPVVVLDCGTCITTEAVDALNCFRGGAILPGRALLRRVLNEHTGQLPLVELGQACPDALGTCTRDAILAGVDVGILGAVERLLADSRSGLGAPSCPVVTVGGDAEFFCRHLPGLVPGQALFTLYGLAVVAARLFVRASPPSGPQAG